jgi:hypothetical protein
LLGEPLAQGQQGSIDGCKFTDLGGHLTVRVGSAQKGRELRLTDIERTTDRMIFD